jgi:hypothetical protein
MDKIAIGHMIAINANRIIAAYQATVGVILLLTLPLAYLFIKLYTSPIAALIAFLITSIGCVVGRVYWGKYLLDLSPQRWLIEVVFRCLLVILLVVPFAILPKLLLPDSLLRLGLSILVSIMMTAISGWYIGLTSPEREYFKRSLLTVFYKVFG